MADTSVGIPIKTRDKLLILIDEVAKKEPYITTYWAVIEFLINYYTENEAKKKEL